MGPLPLSRRIFLLVGTVFFLLLALTSLLLSIFFSNLLIARTEDYLHLVMQQNQNIINAYVKRVDEVAVDIANDRFLYQALSQPLSDSFVDQSITRQTINRYLITTVYVPLRKYFNSVSYWFFIDDSMPAGRMYADYSFPGNKVVPMKQAENVPFLSSIAREGGKVIWFFDPSKPGKIYAACQVLGSYSAVSIANMGILLFEFNVADLFGNIQKVGLTDNSIYYFLSPGGQSFEVITQTGLFTSQRLEEILSSQGILPRRSGQAASSFRAENHFFSVLPLDNQWLLVGVTPFSDILSQTRRVTGFLIPVTFLSLAAVLLLSYVIARSISAPIAGLSDVMRKSTEESNLDVSLPEHKQSVEIAALYDSYAALVERIKLLLQEVYDKGLSVKQAEIRALQAQINPHFLYNTLDSISWTALDLGDSEIPAVVSSLSNILRYSIKEPDKLVSLEEELEIVQHYIDIQRFCYSLAIDTQFEGRQFTAGLKVPKLTLQPLVENAILHGFLENGIKTGTIYMRCLPEDGRVAFEVENAGQADIEKMLAIIHGEGNAEKHGIRNIHHRLQMLFGEEAGLSFYKKADGALVVRLSIPRAAPAAEAEQKAVQTR